MAQIDTWNISIPTSLSVQAVVPELTEKEGLVEGIAQDKGESVPLIDQLLECNRLTWKQSNTKPMRLHRMFDVTGDTHAGTAKAGKRPASAVTGTRPSTKKEGQQ
uniref:Uncharacterized protein n=1 Tax=Thermosporothrix sp. COM3 TaxID=2490863 RepID=A0A455SHC3_9CHLR|nr:hypothetical protein KTC_26240 [Thermosporothrix sp. COM3]